MPKRSSGKHRGGKSEARASVPQEAGAAENRASRPGGPEKPDATAPASQQNPQESIEAAILELLGQGRSFREIKSGLKQNRAAINDDQLAHALMSLVLARRVEPVTSGVGFRLARAIVPAMEIADRVAAPRAAATALALDDSLDRLRAAILQKRRDGKDCLTIANELQSAEWDRQTVFEACDELG